MISRRFWLSKSSAFSSGAGETFTREIWTMRANYSFTTNMFVDALAQYDAAQESSAAAKKWAMWGLIAGIVVFVIYGILIALGAVSMDFDTSTTTDY